MAPLAGAILSTLDKFDKDSATYIGWFDNEWCIGSVPQGGYSLSVMLNAIQAFMRHDSQGGPSQPKGHYDPMNIAASYLAATTATVPYSVEIVVVKRGRGFTNLEASIVQKSSKTNAPQTRISAHILMTSFSTRISDPTNKPTISQDSKFFPKCPIHLMEECEFSQKMKSEKLNMRDRLTLHEDRKLLLKAREEGELKWGAWLQLAEVPAEVSEPGMGNNNIPFFADMILNPVDILPRDVHQKVPSWYPTMHLTVEFKRKIPYNVAIHRTGIYMHGRFIMQGQQDLNAEVWTHPQDNHLFGLSNKDGPQILAVARQCALTLDLSVNQGQNQRKESGEKAKL